MVIAEKFAWAHLAKTAGDATAEMFAAVPGLVRSADPPDSNDKHMPFFGREQQLDGKLLVMNIRRLPAWTVSGAHHQSVHGVYPDYRPLPLESADQMSSKTDADDLLRWMTDHGRFAVDRWFRAEVLEHDVLALLGELGVLSDDVRARVLAVGHINVGSYDHAGEDVFTADQIERMYALNPEWAAIERTVYGSVPLGSGSARVAGERPDL
jgi:hypothetical protein